MTAEEGLPGRVELHVGDEATAVAGLPDERLRVVWDEFTGGGEKKSDRHVVGTTLLAILLVLALLANGRAVPATAGRIT